MNPILAKLLAQAAARKASQAGEAASQQASQSQNQMQNQMQITPISISSSSHLYYDEDMNVNEQYLSKHRTASSVGVAVSKNHLKSELIEICHKMKYEVFYWRVRDDQPEIPFGCPSYTEFYNHLKISNVDGIITDFGDNCKNTINQVLYSY